MKRVININNITIIYDESWGKEQSNKKKKSLVAVTVVMSIVLIGLFTVLVNLTRNIWINTLIFIPMTVIIKMIVDAIALDNLYGDECVEYRALDWFSEQQNIEATMQDYEVVIKLKDGNTQRLSDILDGLNCLNRISYENKFNMDESTSIEVVIDATRKSIAEIDVWIVSDDDTEDEPK